jgi:diguanylate cyclase (GGDEF)-like protein
LAERLAIYRLLASFPSLARNYERKFALGASVGVLVPLTVFIIYLLDQGEGDLERVAGAIAALVLACVAGFLGALWLIREILVPVDLTEEALRDYIETRRLPNLPTGFEDRAGRLMQGTQYTITQLNETITRLEKISANDELTGVYNRRSAERRLAEEVARADRDRETFHLMFLDINRFREINPTYGHSVGDACIAHVARMLESNIRRGDWVARWAGDEFVVGLHRNQAVRPVVERIVRAIEVTPCVLPSGEKLLLAICCGVGEYGFGTGTPGILQETDRAMFRAKERSRVNPHTHVCYWDEATELVDAR